MARRFDAVIFDMDGTLVEQMLDFQEIRQELGISPCDGILEAIQQMPPADRKQASSMLLNHELAAARKAVMMPGAAEVIERIRAAGMKNALLTRNARPAMDIVLAKLSPGLPEGKTPFDLAWSREDGPIKPQPDGILRACRQLGVVPQRSCCVGDFHYDITAANAAGATSVLLTRGRQCDFADEADHVIEELSQLPKILGV